MAQLYEILRQKSKYYDKNNFNTQQQYDQAVRVSTTVYVGNLSYNASQDSIQELFSRAGLVKKIIMGINNEGERCGFCFVIFSKHQEAQRAVDYISHTKLNDKIIRVDLDPGYKEGRQKGRGRDGNQKRHDFKYKQHQQGSRGGKFYDRGQRRGGQYRGGGQRNYNNSRDNYGRQRYQRSREYNQHQPQQGAPRHMSRKQHQQQKSQEQY